MNTNTDNQLINNPSDITENKLWINKTIKSNSVSNELLNIFIKSGILKPMRMDTWKSTSCFLANLVKQYIKSIDKLYYNGHEKSHSYPIHFDGVLVKPTYSYNVGKIALTALEDNNYIFRVRGYRCGDRSQEGYIVLTEKFKSLLKELGVDKKDDNSGQQCLIITDKLTRKSKGFNRGEPKVGKEIINKIRNYNKFLSKFSITYNEGYHLTAWMCRIFQDNLNLHGRIYNLYGAINYQTLPQEVRKTIKIDGKNTVELDYKHLHPSLCYEDCNAKYVGDMYGIDIDINMIFDIPEAVVCNGNYSKSIRKLAKEAFLRMLNTDSKEECKASLVKMLREDQQKQEPSQEFVNLRKDFEAVSSAMMDAIEDKHDYIYNYFYTGISLALMNKDSNILMHILIMCEEKGIPALPIHDSVIVPEDRVDIVKEIMYIAYEEVMGSKNNCHVEVK